MRVRCGAGNGAVGPYAPLRCRLKIPQSSSTFVKNASPMKRRLASARSPASLWPAPHASVTTTGMYPRSAPWRTVGSIPISVATPTMMNADLREAGRTSLCSRHSAT